MQIESSFRHPVELMQAAFSIRPETFDAVNGVSSYNRGKSPTEFYLHSPSKRWAEVRV